MLLPNIGFLLYVETICGITPKPEIINKVISILFQTPMKKVQLFFITFEHTESKQANNRLSQTLIFR